MARAFSGDSGKMGDAKAVKQHQTSEEEPGGCGARAARRVARRRCACEGAVRYSSPRDCSEGGEIEMAEAAVVSRLEKHSTGGRR